MSRLIFVIGMSGAGKTTWGRRLSEASGLPFTDIDEYLEQAYGMSITQMFRQFGEAGFRIRERQALGEVIARTAPPAIVSCGGGTPVDLDNLADMKKHGLLVYLKAEIATLVENLQQEAEQRPLLRNHVINPRVRLSELYEKRRRTYEQADYMLNVEDLAIRDFEPILQACIAQH